MEDIADFEKLVRVMHSKLKQQAITVEQLAIALARSGIQLNRNEQVTRLGVLKSRINKEVEDIERMEAAAQTEYMEGTLLNSGLTFAFGSLFMKAMGHKDSLKVGVQMAGSVLSKTVPFGNVFISIGKDGIPEDVRVIPISRLARESKKSESNVAASLKGNGYLMMTIEVFTKALDRVEREILNESLSLPIKISEITKRITR